MLSLSFSPTLAPWPNTLPDSIDQWINAFNCKGCNSLQNIQSDAFFLSFGRLRSFFPSLIVSRFSSRVVDLFCSLVAGARAPIPLPRPHFSSLNVRLGSTVDAQKKSPRHALSRWPSARVVACRLPARSPDVCTRQEMDRIWAPED